MNLALIGFMGSGKTTTSIELQKFIPKNKLFSIDEEIEKKTKNSIAEIFKNNGETYFRNIEHNILKNIILYNKNYILDLGGGAFIQDENRKLLKNKDILNIFLDVPFDLISKRLENDKKNRPLLQKENWKLKAKQLFDDRYQIYTNVDIIINIKENQNQIFIANLIKEIYNQHYK